MIDEVFKITDKGIVYVPRFVKQESDMEYGSVVTHENYNEKLNLNTTQGDYNTEILRLLLSVSNPKDVPHIPYLDKIIEDQVNRLDGRINDNYKEFDDFRTETNAKWDDVYTQLEDHDKRITANYNELDLRILNIINGVTKVKSAEWADHIVGIDKAGEHFYYGTDYDGTEGFFRLPDALYAEDIESGMPEIGDIVFTPRPNSVDETMLTEALRDKINREGISDYDQLTSRPRINGITLTGNKTLSDLGIQPAGNYITEIPSEYITESELADVLNKTLSPTNVNERYVKYNEVSNEFLKIATFNNFKNNDIANMNREIERRNRTFINAVGTGETPREGDWLVTF